jgi:hypothetical protein
MLHAAWDVFRQAWRGTLTAIKARPWAFFGVAAAVFLLNLLLPPLVLALVRKPWDHFSFNPWLSHLPQWLVSPQASIGRKVEFLSDVSLFWFIASSPYDAPEWAFSVGVRDIARSAGMSLLIGAYFALWLYARGRIPGPGRGWNSGGRGGVVGALLSTLGLSTAPCSVAGCGAPVLPVLGLAFQGLTSGMLAGLATLSRLATAVVFVGAGIAVLALGWVVGHRQGGEIGPIAEGGNAARAAGVRPGS